MKLIRFPRAAPTPKVQADPRSRLAIGSVPFTCAECGNRSRLDFGGVVFRQCEFYCTSCGSFYRVTNPAFANTTNPPVVGKPNPRNKGG
jgi:hypothetical protein